MQIKLENQLILHLENQKEINMMVGLLVHSLHNISKLQKELRAPDNESININGVIIGTYSETKKFAEELNTKIVGWGSDGD